MSTISPPPGCGRVVATRAAVDAFGLAAPSGVFGNSRLAASAEDKAIRSFLVSVPEEALIDLCEGVEVKCRAAPLASEGAWLLLAEWNHRVGNELQAALSALRLAKRELGSAEAARFIEEALVRLECFGNVHRLLDRQRGQGPLAQHLEALCRATSLSKAARLGIHLMLSLDDVAADEETTWTVCVVAFELITNAFKHAFPGGLPGAVRVVLRQDGAGILLTVTDNGVGAGAGRRSAEAVRQAPGLGSGIVTQLAEHLGGFVTRVSGPDGTTATFRVPAARCIR